MKIGMTAVFHNPYDRRPDAEVYESDLALAALAEPLGYDSLWTVEHHFDDYCLAPDPFQILTWFAARTERVALGSMVVVLPWWHDPIRIAEKAALLDHFSGGRFILGVGRGAAWSEFEAFSVPMEESRDRFVESAELVLAALETGIAEYDGKFVKQIRTPIRPTPRGSFVGRRYAAAVSPESSAMMARLGLALLIIPQKPWPMIREDVATHRAAYLAAHGAEPPPCVTSLLVYCDEERDRLAEVTRAYVRPQAENVTRHYDFSGARSNVKGYESYGKVSNEQMIEAQVPLQIIGTPEECYRKLVDVQRVSGTDHFSGVFSFAGLPRPAAERSIGLFAREVVPALQKLEPTEAAA
ncbi:MAG: LLM class flavin-dependent oxidoreductase [Candidatus Binatia bacterium]